ncbi:MAG: hypothetical protein ACRDQ9_11340 [Pseudonocardiaceae bacterium]
MRRRTPGTPDLFRRHATVVGPPIRQNRYGLQVHDPPGTGEFVNIGGNALQGRLHPGQVEYHVCGVGPVLGGAQVDRRRERFGVDLGQPRGALPQPTSLPSRSAIRSRPPRLGARTAVGIFRGGAAHRPQLIQSTDRGRSACSGHREPRPAG